MTGRGHKASLPVGGHRAAAPLAPDGLVVTLTYATQVPSRFDFADLPVAPPMQLSLARLFAARSARWNSHETARSYWVAVTAFARFVAAQPERVEDLGDISAALLKRWRMKNIATSGGVSLMNHIRPLLKADERLSTGPAAEELLRRLPVTRSTRSSFTADEQRQVVLAAQRQFRRALLRVRENAWLLAARRAGELEEDSKRWRIAEILDHLARTGYVPACDWGGPRNRTLLGGSQWQNTWGRLYLDRAEITALAVLLTHRFGWNLAVYDRLPVPTTAPSAGTGTPTYRIEVEKRRQGGGRWFSTENVTDTGPGSPGRLVTHALEATAFGRHLAAALAPGTDRLMVARNHQPSGRTTTDPARPSRIGPLAVGVADSDARLWARANGLSGSPFQRSRRTTVIREGRPLQHTPGTHESVYVLPDEHVQRASRDVFADGAHEALVQAKAVFGGSLGDRPEPGHASTVTADCESEESSPWPDGAGGCAADFLLCLACRNAHVHPGHHTRLAHLRHELLSLRSALPAAAWLAAWSEHADRLEDLRGRIGPAAWDAARLRANADDRTLAELLLKGTIRP